MLEVVSVLDAGLHLWFEVGRQPDDYEKAYQFLADNLAEGHSSKNIRLVALDNNKVVARLFARRDPGGRFTLGWPTYHNDLAEEARRQVAIKLIEACVEQAKRDERFHYLEAKPADDVPELDLWIPALQSCGFTLTAIAHLLIKRGDLTSLPSIPSVPIDIRRGDEVSLNQLRELFQKYQSVTLDRADADPLQSSAASFDEFLNTQWLEADRSLWRVGFYQNQAIGLVVVSLPKDEAVDERNGLILSIGVVPAMRRHGIGKALLASGIKSLQSGGAQEIHALIDDLNIPSLILHRWAGFIPEPEKYMVYRRALS